MLGSGWSAAADDLGELIGSCELAELPGFAAPTVLGHGGALRVVRTSAGKIVAVLTGRTHFYEARDVRPGGARRTGDRGGGREDPGADQRLRQPEPRLGPGHRGADRRPHQPHRRLAAASARPSSTCPRRTPAGCATLARTVDPEPARGRVRAVRRPAVRDPGRGADGRRAGRGPGRHVHRAGDHRRPRGRPGGARASRWSPTWPPASRPSRSTTRRCWRPGARRLPGCARCWPASPPPCERAAARRGPAAPHRRLDRAGPRPADPAAGRTTCSARRPRAASRRSAELADAFTGRLEFGTAGLRGALGPGTQPDEPGGGRPGGGRAGHLPARPGTGRRPGDHRLRRPAQLRRVRPRHRRDHGRGRLRRHDHRRPAAHPGGRLRHPAPRLRGRGGGHRVAQPAAGQRLQGLPGRRLADRAAGRRRDRGPDRRGGRAPAERRAPLAGLRHARRRAGRRPTSTGSPAWCRRRRPRAVDWVYTPLHGVGGSLVERAVAPRPASRPPRWWPSRPHPTPTSPPSPSPTRRSPARSTWPWPGPSEVGADLVVANDPDADRCAVADGGRRGLADAARRRARRAARRRRPPPRRTRHVRLLDRLQLAAGDDGRRARPAVRLHPDRVQVDRPGAGPGLRLRGGDRLLRRPRGGAGQGRHLRAGPGARRWPPSSRRPGRTLAGPAGRDRHRATGCSRPTSCRSGWPTWA